MVELVPLIVTKFQIPPTRPDLVTRPRLFELLDRCPQHPLTLLSAPPGFGKTMLVASWLAARPHLSCAWLTLDERDNHPAAFWRYVITAVQHLHPTLGHTAQEMLGSSAPPPAEAILATLINDLSDLDQVLLLVLDDYHQVHNPAIHDSLKFLLEHQPAHLNLLLLTREDPPLGLARRRARRQLLELRAAELRFTPSEMEAFLQSHLDLALSPDQFAILARRTEGWIAGLQLAALSLQGRDPQAFFESFAGDERFIADYLIEEALEQQPPAVRDFLLKTSILDRMCTGLCQALTGVRELGFQAETLPVLAWLERSNLFLVPLDQRREWYRYHHLFADLLRQRLKQSLPPTEILALHQQACEWYEANQDILAAIHHGQQAGDSRRVAGLLQEHVVQFFLQSELPRFVDYVSQLPPELVEASPYLCMAAAWGSLANGEEINPWLQKIETYYGMSAEAALQEAEMAPQLRAAMLEVVIIRQQTPYEEFREQTQGRLLAIQSQLDTLPGDQMSLFNDVANLKTVVMFNLGLDHEMRGEVEQAAACFQETVRQARQLHNNHLTHLALGHLAQVQMARGQLDAARQTYQEALERHAAGSTSPFVAFAHAGLGQLAYEWGELDLAQQHFEAGLPMARSWKVWETLAPLALGLARLHRRRGRPAAALALLDTLPPIPTPNLHALLEGHRSLWAAEDGEPDPAARWLAASGQIFQAELRPYTEPLILLGCRLLLEVQRPAEAIPALQKLSAAASSLGRAYVLVQSLVLLARALALTGQSAAAQSALLRALRLAEPQGCRSTFLEQGEAIRRVLEQLPGQPYTRALLADFESLSRQAAAQPRPPQGSGLLSPRELEVLEWMAQGLSNLEIADRLVISITTVKTHTGNIFNKLGAANRTQAVALARTAGLLPPA